MVLGNVEEVEFFGVRGIIWARGKFDAGIIDRFTEFYIN